MLKKQPDQLSSTALSILASSKTIIGDFPPNSRQVFFKLDSLEAYKTFLPTRELPVKLTFLTSGCLVMASPVICPYPGNILSTPGGKPASTISEQKNKHESGVTSEHFITIQFPAAKQGAIFQVAIRSG